MQQEFITLPTKAGAAMESQSGHFFYHPRVYGVLAGPSSGAVGAIVVHPTSNFHGHYLLPEFARRGIGLLGFNTRFVGNDTVLIMERAIQDLGAAVRFMRGRFKKVFLIGNSGGASLVSFYQSQAERLTVTHTPAGDPVDLEPGDLPVADGIAILAGHLGRPFLLSHWIDASLTDENDPLSCDQALDIFHPDNRPPFAPAFVEKVRAAQQMRMKRITDRVKLRLAHLRSLPQPIHDEPFLVYRTYADPRFVDLSLDSNDRAPGGNKKDGARTVNYGVNNLARTTSLTGWMSQWSFESNADGPSNLRRTSIPVLNLEFTADGAVFPSDVRRWSEACTGREQLHRIVGATHYMHGQQELVDQVCDLCADWGRNL